MFVSVAPQPWQLTPTLVFFVVTRSIMTVKVLVDTAMVVKVVPVSTKVTGSTTIGVAAAQGVVYGSRAVVAARAHINHTSNIIRR